MCIKIKIIKYETSQSRNAFKCMKQSEDTCRVMQSHITKKVSLGLLSVVESVGADNTETGRKGKKRMM